MTTVLKVSNVNLAIGGQVILKDVSLEVGDDETVALVGPNGAGKTSLFNCITRSYKPQSGSIIYRGTSLLELPAHRLARLGIARTFQGIELLPERTVLENILLGAHVYMRASWVENLFGLPRSRRAERSYRSRAIEVLGQVGLNHAAKRLVQDLSFSQQKFVEIARCLMLEPELLLLDEPVAGLSQAERREVLDLLKRLRQEQEVPILLVEHDLAFVKGLATRCVALDFGSIIAEGSPEHVLTSPEVVRAFIGEPAAESDSRKRA